MLISGIKSILSFLDLLRMSRKGKPFPFPMKIVRICRSIGDGKYEKHHGLRTTCIPSLAKNEWCNQFQKLNQYHRSQMCCEYWEKGNSCLAGWGLHNSVRRSPMGNIRIGRKFLRRVYAPRVYFPKTQTMQPISEIKSISIVVGFLADV